MLTIVRTAVPVLELGAAALPAPLPDLLAGLASEPERHLWLAPTQRRRRFLTRMWRSDPNRSASLLPVFHTLETFVSEALGYSDRQRPRVSDLERTFLVAAAWQDVCGRLPDSRLTQQLDRYARDWHACRLPPPSEAISNTDQFLAALHRRRNSLNRHDRMAALRALCSDLDSPESWVDRLYLAGFRLVIAEGFHRLDAIERELIVHLARRTNVLIWLVGSPGQHSGAAIESACRDLSTIAGSARNSKSRLPGGASARAGSDETRVQRLDYTPSSATPLSLVGRRLFPCTPDAASSRAVDSLGRSVDGRLLVSRAADPRRELERIADQIKADYLESVASGEPFALREIAVVIPGPSYDALVREVFPRAGLEFNLAGQALTLANSRPARVVAAAWNLVHGEWRCDLLDGFLSQPVVRRRLECSYRLDELLARRPRARRTLRGNDWLLLWRRLIVDLKDDLERFSANPDAVPPPGYESREHYLDRQANRIVEVGRLLASIEAVLQPVLRLEELFYIDAVTLDAFHQGLDATLDLLDVVKTANWLEPPAGESEVGAPVPWVEFEKDQRAYLGLRNVINDLAGLGAGELPELRSGTDIHTLLELALEGQSYQIKTEDDAGVQILGAREIRGLTFRHIYAVGLIEGLMPRVPEEGAFAQLRRQEPALRRQLEEKEEEAEFLFTQLFESARDRLVLSYPRFDAGGETQPSRFLQAVFQLVEPTDLTGCSIAASARTLHVNLGSALRNYVPPAYAAAGPGPAAERSFLLDDTLDWLQRDPQNRIEPSALMEAAFPENRPFSASSLEAYFACPFRFFGSNVLRLRERDSDSTRRDYGTIVHRVLQRYTEERLRQVGASVESPPTAPSPPHDRSRLLELFDEEVGARDEGFVPQHLRQLFAAEGGVADLFLESQGQLEAAFPGFASAACELALAVVNDGPVPVGRDSAGRAILVTGTIDRVDVDHDTRRMIAVDYKTGRAKLTGNVRKRISDGRVLQLPLYLLALETLFPDYRALEAAYLHLNEGSNNGSDVLCIRAEADESSGKGAIAWQPEALRELVRTAADRIRAGEFPLTSHDRRLDANNTECQWYCAFRHVCRQPHGFVPRPGG